MTAATTPDSPKVSRPLRFDIEDDLFKAIALNSLAEWVTTAREYISELQAIAEIDEALSAALRNHSFAVNDGDWADDVQAGARLLHQEIGARLRSIRCAAGLGFAS